MSDLHPDVPGDLESAAARLRGFLRNHGAPDDITRDLDGIIGEATKRTQGLVFAEQPEPSERLIERGAIALVEREDLRLGSGGRENWIIEGENLLALTLLGQSIAGKVDVICIDPPYNTGMSNLGYIDHGLLDPAASYPHGAWLSFMARRLRLAHSLLSEKGVLFLHVDENETGTALLLCESIFGEGNTVALVWPKTDARFDKNRMERPFRNIKMVHEYVIVCYRKQDRTTLNKVMRPYEESGTWMDRPADMESILSGLGTTSSAKDELGDIFGDRDLFRTPKPMRLIKEFVRAASTKDSIVLDFFAGSGTTGHAVMDLNQEDGGRRSFYLVNNNENNICRRITYERLKKVMEREGYDERLRYYVISAADRSDGQ